MLTVDVSCAELSSPVSEACNNCSSEINERRFTIKKPRIDKAIKIPNAVYEYQHVSPHGECKLAAALKQVSGPGGVKGSV